MKPGVMIEVPAAALLAYRLLEHVEFLSIGTNDLSQYTMAADRLSGELAGLTDSWQPAVLHLIAITAAAGKEVGKPVGVCGEAAADPLLACVLFGVGITSLSMATSAIGQVGASLGGGNGAGLPRRGRGGAGVHRNPVEARAAAAEVLRPLSRLVGREDRRLLLGAGAGRGRVSLTRSSPTTGRGRAGAGLARALGGSGLHSVRRSSRSATSTASTSVTGTCSSGPASWRTQARRPDGRRRHLRPAPDGGAAARARARRPRPRSTSGVELLRAAGADAVLVLPFTPALAAAAAGELRHRHPARLPARQRHRRRRELPLRPPRPGRRHAADAGCARPARAAVVALPLDGVGRPHLVVDLRARPRSPTVTSRPPRRRSAGRTP